MARSSPLETGAQGEKGEKGDVGAPGQDGANGKDGADGETGPQGETGAPGADGAQGPASPPSNRCGSPSRNTMSLAHPLSTGNASKCSAKFSQILEQGSRIICRTILGLTNNQFIHLFSSIIFVQII